MTVRVRSRRATRASHEAARLSEEEGEWFGRGAAFKLLAREGRAGLRAANGDVPPSLLLAQGWASEEQQDAQRRRAVIISAERELPRRNAAATAGGVASPPEQERDGLELPRRRGKCEPSSRAARARTRGCE